MRDAHAGGLGAPPLVASALPVGKLGVWWFLASEIVLFGGLIGVYMVYFLGAKGLGEAAAHLSLSIGTVNTLVLLTSSLTMVLAFAAVERGDERGTRMSLAGTVLLGLTFLVIKGFEWGGEIGAGFTPTKAIFWSFYYTMTGLHALHVLGGVAVNGILLLVALSGGLKPIEHRVEFAGLYWHFVDVVWIFLFPLLYLSQ